MHVLPLEPGVSSPPAARPTAGPAPPATAVATPPPAPGGVTLVEVLFADPGGVYRVVIDGRTEVVRSGASLAPGERYVLRVDRTPGGVVPRGPLDGPDLPREVAAAVLRGSAPPDLGPAVGAVLGELAGLPATGPVGEAAAAVREAVGGFLPADGRPPDAARLQNLVENGGLHHEAKLAREAAGGEREPSGHHRQDAGATKEPALAAPARPQPDFKGGLLQLLHAARDAGVTLPAARAAVDGIEAQQAANVLAADEGTPYVLQVPVPDGDRLRTLNLAVEAERPGADGGPATAGEVRLLLHVPLTDLGDVWVDAGLRGGRVRAAVYLEDSTARERVRAELPALRQELRAGGFDEVLLDIRPAADLPGRRRQLAAALAAGRTGGDPVLDVRA